MSTKCCSKCKITSRIPKNSISYIDMIVVHVHIIHLSDKQKLILPFVHVLEMELNGKIPIISLFMYVFLNKICPLSVVVHVVVVIVVINFSHFHLLQNHWANFKQTWHKASMAEGDSNLYK